MDRGTDGWIDEWIGSWMDGGTFSGEAHWHPTKLPSLKYLQFLTFSVSRGHVSAPSVLSPTHHEMGRNRAGAMAQRLRD